jgi:hypothetical protein
VFVTTSQIFHFRNHSCLLSFCPPPVQFCIERRQHTSHLWFPALPPQGAAPAKELCLHARRYGLPASCSVAAPQRRRALPGRSGALWRMPNTPRVFHVRSRNSQHRRCHSAQCESVKARHRQTVRKGCMATLRRGKGRQLARSFRQVGGSARRIIGSMGRRSQQSTPVRLPVPSPGAASIVSRAP